MDNEQFGTFDYAKLFLLMIIPVYGFFFTVLLAFSGDIGDELKYLARGALIARIVFLLFLVFAFSVMFSVGLPAIDSFINRINVFRLFR